MGTNTTTITSYECDMCWKDVPESLVYRGTNETLWSDRDTATTLYLSARLEISYVTDNGVICKACAAGALRKAADQAEREFTAVQGKGDK